MSPWRSTAASSTAWPGYSHSCWPDGADAPSPPSSGPRSSNATSTNAHVPLSPMSAARIARELHDVIAHSVSVDDRAGGGRPDATPDAPGAGRAAAPRGRGDRSAGAGRDAPTARDPARGRRRRPWPRSRAWTDLPALAEAVRHAGLPVEVSVEGSPRPLPAGLGLTAYRIVQEALTNTLKHAGRAARPWSSATSADAARLDVSDDGRAPPTPADGAGHGLPGMRERVASTAVNCDAGPGPTAASRSAPGCRSSRRHRDPGPRRRRPGPGPRRLPADPGTQPDIEVVGEAGDGAKRSRGRGAAARCRADGHPDAGHGRARGDPRLLADAGPAAGAHAHDLRPRRVRLRRAARRRQRIPAQRRPPRAARRRGSGGRRRRLAARPGNHPTAGRAVRAAPAARRGRRRSRRAHRPRTDVLRLVARGRPTAEIADSCSSASPPSRPTSPTCSPNSACATGPRPSSSPTSPG